METNDVKCEYAERTKTFNSSYAQFQCVEMYNNQIVDSWSGSPLLCGQRSGNEYVTGGTVNINQIYNDSGIEANRITELVLKFNISGNTSYTVTTNIGSDPKLVETRMSGNEVVTVNLKKIKEMGYNDFAIFFAQGSFSSLYFNTIEMTYGIDLCVNNLNYRSCYNLAYGPENPFQTLDIHYFPNSVNRPVILTIHGGHWRTGDADTCSKQYYNYMTEPIINAGCVHVNINYRLLPYNGSTYEKTSLTMGKMTEDINSAIKFIKNNYAAYIDTNKMALMGWSAGAQLAMLYAYTNNSPIPIKLVIDEAGPTDFCIDGAENRPELQILLEKDQKLTQAEWIEALQGASPAYQVTISPTDLNTFIVYGSSDNVVPYSQVQSLVTAFNNSNRKQSYEVIKLEGVSHDDYPRAFRDNVSGHYMDKDTDKFEEKTTGYQDAWKDIVSKVLKP